MLKTRESYEADIRKFHADLAANPTSEKVRRQLKNRLSKWAGLQRIAIRVASNEQKPWTEGELGFITIPMAKKSVCGFDQVGDYQFEILRSDHEIMTGRFIIERKEISDLYGTLMNRKMRDRFNREVKRYEADPRFDLMLIMVEGSITDFMNYVPEIYVCRQDQIPGLGSQRLVEYLDKYYNIKDADPHKVERLASSGNISIETDTHKILLKHKEIGRMQLIIDATVEDTLYVKRLYGKPAIYQMKGASDESKIATIAKLFTGETPISWCDTRELAIKLYLQEIRQWCIKNYDIIIDLQRG